MTKTIDLSIHGVTFAAPQPFAEGHKCSAGEASVLNSVLAENLKNNFAKRVKAKLNGKTEAHPADVVELSKEFLQYASQYVLAPRPSVDPLSRAAHRIASDLVREALNAKGQKPSDLADGLFDKYVEQVASRPNVLAEAKRRVEATKSIVAATLDLDGIGD